MRTISAPPVLLEPLVASHAHEMFSVLSDPAIYQFENEPPISEEALTGRYIALERRQSHDGGEVWLNWVIRVPSGELAGYVQATVLQSGVAYVAYELASRFWRQGIGSAAVAAMLTELQENHGVTLHAAILKSGNYRSLALLQKLGFQPASTEQRAAFAAAADELAMVKPVANPSNAVELGMQPTAAVAIVSRCG